MERVPVISSQLASVGYDPTAEILEIEFSTGAVYRYEAVPSSEYEALIAAESKGKQFNQAIRGKFKYERTEQKEPALHSLALNLRRGRYLLIYPDGGIKLIVERPTRDAIAEVISQDGKGDLEVACLKHVAATDHLLVVYRDPVKSMPENSKATEIWKLSRPDSEFQFRGIVAILHEEDLGN